MVERAYFHRGGREGILVSREELIKYSNKIGSEALDEFIPLPNGNSDIEHDCDKQNHEYWEDGVTGSHGWCCPVCGKVVQWG